MTGNNMMLRLQTALMIFLSVPSVVECQDLFTSMAKLTPLVDTEKQLLKYVTEYIENEQNKLQTIKSLLSDIRQERSSTPDLKHPVETHMLIRRLRRQWIQMEKLIGSENNAQDYKLKVAMLNVSFDYSYPAEDDYKGSIDALLRLQETYNLNASDIADGNVRGHRVNSASLQAEDCLDIGKNAWASSTADVVCQWMEEAGIRLNNDSRSLTSEIVTHRVECLMQKDKITKSFAGYLLEQVLEEDPENIYAHQKLKEIQLDVEQNITAEELQSKTDYEDYKALCRGEDIRAAEHMEKAKPMNLSCRYSHYNRPSLFIRPAKEEVLHIEPWVVQYHDILTDKEIDLLLAKAKSKLGRSSIVTDSEYGSLNGRQLESKWRISSVAWLQIHKLRGLRNILPRVEAYTGLSTDPKYTDRFQIANYGLGGYFGTHYDDSEEGMLKGTRFGHIMGRRIATILSYLSDVEEGGYTVFPKLGISVPPTKGSAILWFNFLKNGKQDKDSMHAGCPVLLGEKWASNLWIYENGQTFRRKRGLTANDIH